MPTVSVLALPSLAREAEAALPVPSAPSICWTPHCALADQLLKKKKSSLNLEKLIIALHSEPCGGLIKNIHLLG